MFKTIVAVLLVLICAARAAGQTTAAPASTQPADSPWAQTVRQFAQALVDADHAGAAGALSEGAAVRAFNGDATRGLERLQARAMKATLISARGYHHPPPALAADLAADIQASAILAEELARRMVPEDDQQMQRANATAGQWLVDVLKPTKDQPVGILVIWCEDTLPRRLSPAIAPSAELVFVLIKGEPAGNDQFKITQVVYGDPLDRK